jgi:predicted DCC family thiol-disulfide oxidoreductase YuxK
VKSNPVLIYDGDCGFCSWTVGFVLAREKARSLHFAALSSPFARRIIERRPDMQGIDSVFWVELDASGAPTEVLNRSSAVLRIVRYLGGWWSFLSVASVVPRPTRDWIYDRVARNRRRIMDPARCLVIPPESKHRFLDSD